MASVTSIEYSKNHAKVYLSDGRQSPKIELGKVNEWVEKNKDKVEAKEKS